METRFLICGGRDFSDRNRLFTTLDNFHAGVGIGLIIHGAARGADTLAGEWASARDVPVQVFPAAWSTYGRAAGSIRNAKMLREGQPHFCVAFPGGTGTADMIRRAERAGVRVCVLG